MTPEERLAGLGLSVPEVVPPVAAYLPAVRSGQHVYTAGQIPMREGTLVATGKVGDGTTPEQATEAARQCALNAIAAIRSVTGTLENVRIVKVGVFVASAPDFTGQPAVANGASGSFGQSSATPACTPARPSGSPRCPSTRRSRSRWSRKWSREDPAAAGPAAGGASPTSPGSTPTAPARRPSRATRRRWCCSAPVPTGRRRCTCCGAR
ncbi:RidA family protein [Nocardioides convexus]|uniref:RidA family protein n=1 Tax=Nocardioides convexus TaxID=2712224 RepID=UPI003100D2A8